MLKPILCRPVLMLLALLLFLPLGCAEKPLSANSPVEPSVSASKFFGHGKGGNGKGGNGKKDKGIFVDDETGNVGVGTNDPQVQLDVVGDVSVAGNMLVDGTLQLGPSGNNTLSLNDSVFVTSPYAPFDYVGATSNILGIGHTTTNSSAPGAPTAASFQDIQVGIGTFAPTERLDVEGRVKVRDIPSSASMTDLLVVDGTGVLHQRPFSSLAGAFSDADWDFTTNTPHMFSIPTGNVGIGTSTPNSKLDVKGALEVGVGSRGALLQSPGPQRFQLTTFNNVNSSFHVGMGDGAGGIDTTKEYVYGGGGIIVLDNAMVGVNNATPGETLDVDGTAAIRNLPSNPFLTRVVIADPAGKLLVRDVSTAPFASGPDADWDFTTNSPHMFSIPTGNVGIGTSTPNNKLDIKGTLEVGTGFRGALLRSTAGDNFELLTNSTAPNPNWRIGYGNGAGAHDATREFIEAGGGRIRVMNANFGIGTPLPARTLDVAGRARIQTLPSNPALTQLVVADGVGDLFLRDVSTLGIAADNLGNHIMTQNLRTSNRWISNDGDPEGIYIAANGNVGIGTINPALEPTSKLDVNGVLEVGTDTLGALFKSTARDNFTLITNQTPPNANFSIGYGDGAGNLNTAREHIVANDSRVSVKNAEVVLDVAGAIHKQQVRVTGGNLYLDTPAKKLIMRSPNGTCWECGPDNTGAWICTAIVCP